MKIYIDLIFLVDIMYNYLILNSVNIVLCRRIKIRRIFIVSIISSFSCLSFFFPILSNVYITFLTCILTVLLTFGFKDLKYFLNNIFYFYMISVIFGGFLYLINNHFTFLISSTNKYNNKIILNFIGLVILGPVIYFIYKFYYKNGIINHQNYYDVRFSISNDLIDVCGFYDTGNLIKDPYKHRPVILVDKKVIKSDIRNKSPIIVPCRLISDLIMINCYKPDVLIINNKLINNCLIGIYDNYSFNDGVSAIISGYLGDKIR